jgi:hypothetical protein
MTKNIETRDCVKTAPLKPNDAGLIVIDEGHDEPIYTEVDDDDMTEDDEVD